MANVISETLHLLMDDPWRRKTGFSPDVEEANLILFDPARRRVELEACLNSWLGEYQPCLFGRMAAKSEALGLCILTPADLGRTDEQIHDKIQESRLEWRRAALAGEKSGFIILAVSEAIAHAIPDRNTLRLAQRLTQLYLNKEIHPDLLYHEDVLIEKPGGDRMTWKFLGGVNYFSAQGDRRWWQDHRIPGGMALSVNSVGHMMKSAIIGQGMAAIDKKLGVVGEDWNPTKIDSPEQALLFAVKTIGKASAAISGPATKLLAAGTDGDGKPVTGCPFDMKQHSDKNCREYQGYYHTDITLPSEYFIPDVERPEGIKPHTLDFTYIYDNSIENSEYYTIGIGERIRADEPTFDSQEANYKKMRMEPVEVPLSDYPELDRLVPMAE